jgi:hypothetical protein
MLKGYEVAIEGDRITWLGKNQAYNLHWQLLSFKKIDYESSSICRCLP